MRKLFTVLVAVLLTVSVFAQAPQKMSYQAVIRNSSDVLVTNTQIGMEINIRQGSSNGIIVYTETLMPTTNANGLVSIEIGNGAGFSTINWAGNTYYIETKTAVVAPLTTYTITGVSQLLSVPYALSAGNGFSGNYSDLTGKPALWDSTWVSIKNKPNFATVATSGSYNDLSNQPTIPVAQVNSDWNSNSGLSQILNKPTLFSGAYSDLTGNPALWDSSWASIKNIPTFATVATSGSYSDLSNKPTTDGSETKVTAGTNVTVTGTGTTASPYVVNAIPGMRQVDRDLLTPVTGLFVFNTTTNKPNYYNGTAWMNFDGTSAATTPPSSTAIGFSYGGGVIAYILQSGDPGYVAGQIHGLIAAAADQGTCSWYNGSFIVTGATSTAIGAGSANTTTIINSQGNTGTYAAKLCRDYTGGSYYDWYLPSKNELNILYQNRVAIGGFGVTQYWSSTELSDGIASMFYFGYTTAGSSAKDNSFHVRAIRAF